MNLQKTTNENDSVKFCLTYDESESQALKKSEYDKVKKKINIKGFRKGKVPLNIAEGIYKPERLYGTRLREDFVRAVYDNGDSIFQYLDFNIKNDLSVESTVYLYQDVEFTKDVATIKVIKEEPEIENNEIEAVKKTYWRTSSPKIERTLEYQVEKNDDVIVDFIVKVDSEIVATKQDYTFSLGLGLLDEQLERNMIGIKVGENRKFNAVVNGEQHTYDITCKKIYQYQLISEADLLKKLNIETMEKLEKNIFNTLKLQYNVKNRQNFMDELINELAVNSNFAHLPEMGEELSKKSISEVEKNMLKQMHKTNYRKDSLLLSAAKALNIEISEDEIEDKITKMKNLNSKVIIDDLFKLSMIENAKKEKVVEMLIVDPDKEEENV